MFYSGEHNIHNSTTLNWDGTRDNYKSALEYFWEQVKYCGFEEGTIETDDGVTEAILMNDDDEHFQNVAIYAEIDRWPEAREDIADSMLFHFRICCDNTPHFDGSAAFYAERQTDFETLRSNEFHKAIIAELVVHAEDEWDQKN